MTRRSESVRVPRSIRTVRNDNAHRATMYDARLANVLVTYAKSTR
jgi:hypothetical protein